jgi:hypothetical protein
MMLYIKTYLLKSTKLLYCEDRGLLRAGQDLDFELRCGKGLGLHQIKLIINSFTLLFVVVVRPRFFRFQNSKILKFKFPSINQNKQQTDVMANT